MARKRFIFLGRLHCSLKRWQLKFLSLVLLVMLICIALPVFAIAPSQSEASVVSQTTVDFMQQGKTLYDAERFAESVPLLLQAIQQYQRQENGLQQAIALSNLSLAYQQLGQWDKATTSINQSLKLLQDQAESPEILLVLAKALEIQAYLQLTTGKAEAAIETWQRAEKLHVKLNDQDGVIRDLIQQAQALQTLGFYRRALNQLNELHSTLQSQPDSTTKVMGLRSLGDALQLVGELKTSQQILMQGLQIAQRLNNPKEIGAILLSLGNATRQDEPTRAIQYYQQSAKQSPLPLARVQAQLNQLSLQVAIHQRAEASRLTAQILPQLDNLPPNRSAIYAKVNLAQNLIKMNCQLGSRCHNSEKIAQLLVSAVGQAQLLKDQRAESHATGSLAKLYEQEKQFQDAQALTQKALLLSRAIDATDLDYEWQWQLGRLLKQQKQVEQAIPAYLAAVKSLQALRSDLAITNRDIQFSFRDSVEPVYRQAVELLLQSPTEPHLQEARSLIESLQLAELDNFFREACINAQSVLLDQVVDQQNAKAAIIYSIVSENRLNLILKRPGKKLEFYPVPDVSADQIRETVVKLRQNLVDPSALREIQKLSNQVYRWLIAPIEFALNDVDTLVFVLDSDLRSIPMSALYDGQRFLVEKYAIALSPGLQLLAPQPISEKSLKVLAAGLVNPPPEFKDLATLPGIRTEFGLITKAGISTRQLINEEFKSTTLEQEINTDPYNIVHLATHGRFSSKLEETFILAADGQIGVNQLGELLQSRSQTRPEAIELLVLSACETATGDNRATLGLAGVALKSGARSTVASLWTVEDDSTAQFIGAFYQGLQAKLTKAEALRKAQLMLLKQNPRYVGRWASYVLIGNWL